MAFYSQYLNIQDSNASPSNTFFVDSTSVDNGNNTGWVFVNGVFVFPTTNVATAQLGTPSITGDAVLNIVNLPLMTGFVGSVTLEINNDIDVTGLVATSALGLISISINSNVGVTGFAATSALGSVTVTNAISVFPNGLEAVSALGLLSTQTDNYIDVTGLQGTTALGTVDPTAAAVIVIPSQSSSLLFLDIRDCIAAGPVLPFVARASVDSGNNVNWDINFMQPLPGMGAFLGVVAVTGKGNVPVIGLQANAQLGFGLVWGLINEAQNPNWVDIPN
jgi:hypothetical protein